MPDDRINASLNREASHRLFMTEDQIVDDLITQMTPDDRRSWLSVKNKAALIAGHSTTGRAIRNRYLFWCPTNPLTDITDPNSPRFPDQLSQTIMEKVWKRLKSEARKANLT